MNKHIYKNCEEISKNIDIKSFKNKTILITGANGLIGKAFIETYKKKYNIIKCLRKDNTLKLLEK